MKKLLFFLMFAAGFVSSSSAQNLTCGGFSLTSCSSYTLVDDCSGKELFLDGSASVCCVDKNGNRTTRDYPVVRGVLNVPNFGSGCEDFGVCIDIGNWEICDVSGCVIRLYQTVTTKPKMNGSVIANGAAYGGSSAYVGCIGELYTGPINSVHSPTKLKVCPGDPLVLSLKGLSIPDSSELCLTVTVKSLNGNPVSSYTYTGADISGSDVDVTQLFSILQPGTTYSLEYTLHCCSGLSSCTANATMKLYIEVVGEFSFSPWMNYGFYPNSGGGTPPNTTPSLDITAGSILIPNFGSINQVTFIGFGVENTNHEDLSWVLYQDDCNVGLEDLTYSGTIVDPGNPFSIGALFLQNNNQSCICYRLELTYNNGCDLNDIVENYYFKEGLCDPTDLIGQESSETSVFIDKVKASLNNDRLEINLTDANVEMPESVDVTMYNSSGQLMEQVRASVYSGMYEAQVNLTPGIYFYSFMIDGNVYSGKVIKI